MKLLDLFCGAGGAAMGYHRAGFMDITGVDIKPQPHYPFKFIQADAMTFPLEGYDVIHASPPCQGESIMRNLPWLKDKDYPMLIVPTRERLKAIGVPWIIENVFNARKSPQKPYGMQAGYLCGTMFGLPFYRHRLFETSFFWMQPGHPKHEIVFRKGRMFGDRGNVAAEQIRSGGRARHFQRAEIKGFPVGIGHMVNTAKVSASEGIDWMNAYELSQAVPPIFTEFIGKQLMAHLAQERP